MIHVDHPFFGLFSIARGREVKTLVWCGPLRGTQRLPNGWRVFWFRSLGVPMKVVYMAHPVAGAVKENLVSAKKWQRVIEERFPVAVSANWITECEIWDDDNPDERFNAMQRNKAILARCDELWLVGDVISRGMHEEIAHARAHEIPVFLLERPDWEPTPYRGE